MMGKCKWSVVSGAAVILLAVSPVLTAQASTVSTSSAEVSSQSASTHSSAQPAVVTEFLKAVQTEWAQTYYSEMGRSDKLKVLDMLATKVQTMSQSQPDSVELIIWHGIVLSTRAGVDGGLSALKTVKAARRQFELALQMDEYALDGSAHLSLGSLYYQVPPWPIGFGNKKKAAYHLHKALQINPAGIDSNFFYAGYLEEAGDYISALKVLRVALKAEPRPGRELADAGRKSEILLAIDRIKKKTLNG